MNEIETKDEMVATLQAAASAGLKELAELFASLTEDVREIARRRRSITTHLKRTGCTRSEQARIAAEVYGEWDKVLRAFMSALKAAGG